MIVKGISLNFIKESHATLTLLSQTLIVIDPVAYSFYIHHYNKG